MENMGIYEIKNKVNGMFYIGSSYDMRTRWRGHKNQLNRNIHTNNYLQHAWNKYGSEMFMFQILEVVDDRDQLLDIEQRWLDKTKCYDNNVGYNIARYTENLRRLSDEDILLVAKLHREGMHYKQIAKKTGISIATIHTIKNGSAYRNITKLPVTEYKISKLSDEEVLYIARVCKTAIKKNVPTTNVIERLADKFNVTKDIVYSISIGKTWGSITGIKYTSVFKVVDEEVVKNIYLGIKQGLSNEALSEQFGLTTRYINRIRVGEIRSNITGIKHKRQILHEEEVIDIFKRKEKGETTISLAIEYKVSSATINRIKNRKIWRKVTEHL